ncbi:MAG: type IV pilus twitching motility protein PilT [Chitinophagales bacterium]
MPSQKTEGVAPEIGLEPQDLEPIVNNLLREAVQAGASDLHLTVGMPPMFRIHGRLQMVPGKEMLRPADTERLIFPMLSEEQRDRLVQHGEIDFSYRVPGSARFRVNAYRQRGSYGAAIRVIPTTVPSYRDLGLPEVVAGLAHKQNGLVLVVGPTGSGKSTTLASLIDIINAERECHIITLEDPIEYLHRHKKSMINQREIGLDSESFASALRAALRQDPDVILVGEMRDLETISTALTAAETGHLVLATLHTSDAVQTIDRVVDVFPPHQQPQVRIQLASTLQAIIAQQLLPRADGQGRVVATEVLIATPAVRNLIREGKSFQITSLMQTGARIGMQTFDACFRELLGRGLVTRETIQSQMRDQYETAAGR